MTALSSETRPAHDRRRFVAFCVLLVVVLVLFLLIFTSSLSFGVRRLASDIGLLGGGVVTAVSCGLRIRTSSRRKRRAWSLFAGAGAAAAIGNTLVLLAHLGAVPGSYDTYGTFGFVLAMVLAVGAFLVFPTIKRRGADLARILFDGIVVGGSLISIAAVTVFPTVVDRAGSAGERTSSLAFCILDIVIATLAATLVVRGDRADRPVLWLLSSGMVAYAVADLARWVLTAQNRFAYGGPIDVGWIAGYGLFALAARYRRDPSTVFEGPAAATPPLISSSVTFGVFLLAALLRVWRLPSIGTTSLLSVLWVLVLVCVTVRQGLLIFDNEILKRDLERRVEERTSELQDLTTTSQTMLDSVGDGIYGVDHDGHITFVNPSAVAMLGYPEEVLVGANAHDLFHDSRPDGSTFPYSECYIAEAIRLGATTTSEEDQYRRHDHAAFPVEVTASPLGRGSDVQGAVVVFRDMTQRREVDRLKSEFVSVVSHELRTPLTSIRGSLGLLSAGTLGPLSPSASRMVKIALESSERLTRLINDILDIERIESGTMPMEMGRHSCRTLIGDAVDQLQTLATASRIELITGTVADEQIWGDSDRVVQTLVNLLGNAIKFSGPGSRIEVEAQRAADMVVFEVRDQGRGIPPGQIDTVFKRFEQVDSSDARDKGGSGLGLAISRSIVERHGGEIWVESTPGQGSRFFFTLPRADDPASPRSGAPGQDSGGPDSDGPDSDGPGGPGSGLLVEHDQQLLTTPDAVLTPQVGRSHQPTSTAQDG